MPNDDPIWRAVLKVAAARPASDGAKPVNAPAALSAMTKANGAPIKAINTTNSHTGQVLVANAHGASTKTMATRDATSSA